MFLASSLINLLHAIFIQPATLYYVRSACQDETPHNTYKVRAQHRDRKVVVVVD